MKITRAEAISLQIPFQYGADSFRIGTGAWRHLDFALIRIETDDGIVGWGEAFSYTCRAATIAAFNTMVAPLALGHDASDIAGLHAKIQKQLHLFGRYGITVFALSGLDIALWDIAGKSAGKPVHMLLGGNTRASVECYASLLRYSAPALVRQYAGRAVEEGFAAIKLHEIEEPAIAAAREVVPDHRPLLLDVNCEWHPLEAVAAGKRFSKFNLGWFEEPVFPPEDFASIRAVRGIVRCQRGRLRTAIRNEGRWHNRVDESDGVIGSAWRASCAAFALFWARCARDLAGVGGVFAAGDVRIFLRMGRCESISRPPHTAERCIADPGGTRAWRGP
jgi:L-alanine-DL-glutamate epimerase-like enolase superfamily enzyme